MAFFFDHWEIDDCFQDACSKIERRRRSASNASQVSVKRRAVSYASTCKVILVPAKEEYRAAGIELWYRAEDQEHALAQVSVEVNKVLFNCPAMTTPLAMAYLFLPEVEHHPTIRDLLSMQMKKNLCADRIRIAVVDSNMNSGQRIMDSVYTAVAQSQLWESYFNLFPSASKLSSFLSASARWDLGGQPLFDAIIINESVLFSGKSESEENACSGEGKVGNGTNSSMQNFVAGTLDRLLMLYRAVLGSNALIGLVVSEKERFVPLMVEEALRSAAIDFIWRNDDAGAPKMLPLLLATKSRDFSSLSSKVHILKDSVHS